MDEKLIQAGTENFNLPHDVVQLPTGGVFYKSKKKSVKMGYLTANDENILINSIQGDRDNVVMSLIRGKLYEPELRPDELLESDIEALLLFLRNTSFGPEYKVSLTDPKTDKKFTTEILLDELNIKKTNVKPDENGFFTTTLPKSNVTVKLRPISYGEAMEIEKMVEQYPAGRVAPKINWRLMKQIQEINGDSDKGNIAKFIDSLPIADSKYIRNFLKENIPSLDLTKTIKAPSGELVTTEIAFGVEFFRPFF
jgi:hypothetical protein